MVDDGIATGSTARVACQVARAHGAARVILAVPVAPRGTVAALADAADEVICLESPEPFFAIGQWYEDFAQSSDADVVGLLRQAGLARGGDPPDPPRIRRLGGDTPAAHPASPANKAGLARGGDPPEPPGISPRGNDAPQPPEPRVHDRAADDARPEPPVGEPEQGTDAEVAVVAGPVMLPGHLTVPPGARGIVVFAHGSGSSRNSPRNLFVAGALHVVGLGTLLFDLLTPRGGGRPVQRVRHRAAGRPAHRGDRLAAGPAGRASSASATLARAPAPPRPCWRRPTWPATWPPSSPGAAVPTWPGPRWPGSGRRPCSSWAGWTTGCWP